MRPKKRSCLDVSTAKKGNSKAKETKRPVNSTLQAYSDTSDKERSMEQNNVWNSTMSSGHMKDSMISTSPLP